MLTAAQTIHRTVQVQQVKTLTQGQKVNQAGPMVAVPGLGNVTSTFVDVGSNDKVQLVLATKSARGRIWFGWFAGVREGSSRAQIEASLFAQYENSSVSPK